MKTYRGTGRVNLRKQTTRYIEREKTLVYKNSANKKINQVARSKKRLAREAYINRRIRTELNHARKVQQTLLQQHANVSSSNYFLVIGMLVVTAFFIAVASIETI